MITQAGSGLRYVGKMTLDILNGKVIGRRDTLILFSSLTGENRGVKAIIDMVNNNQAFNKVAGAAATPLEGPDELGSMMADALTSQLHVDFAFQNRGGIRISSLPAGNITLKDVYKLDPFNNQVVIFSMRTDEIRSLICYGYERDKKIDLQVSGMTYRITDDGTGKCREVEMFDMTGNPLDPEKEYSVAVSNYVAYTYTFTHRDPGTLSTMTTSEALINFLGTSGRIDYYGVKRATTAQ
jgi:5'-nucleotidase